jgi:charged multivesicular body protein 3
MSFFCQTDIWSAFFPRRLTVREVGLKYRAKLQTDKRVIEREIRAIDVAIKQAKVAAKAGAAKGGIDAARPLVLEIKDLTRQRLKLFRTADSLGIMATKMTELTAINTIITTFAMSAEVMAHFNRMMSVARTRETAVAMAKEFLKMDLIEKDMAETIEATQGGDDAEEEEEEVAEEEEDEIVTNMLDEIMKSESVMAAMKRKEAHEMEAEILISSTKKKRDKQELKEDPL